MRQRRRRACSSSIRSRRIWSELLTAAPGSVSQVRESAARLVRFAKETGTSSFPRRPRHQRRRHRRAARARAHGRCGAVFRRRIRHRASACCARSRTASARSTNWACSRWATRACAKCRIRRRFFCPGTARRTPGSAVMVTREGTRPLLVEVQALVDQSPLAQSAARHARARAEPSGDAARGAASPRRRRRCTTRTCS